MKMPLQWRPHVPDRYLMYSRAARIWPGCSVSGRGVRTVDHMDKAVQKARPTEGVSDELEPAQGARWSRASRIRWSRDFSQDDAFTCRAMLSIDRSFSSRAFLPWGGCRGARVAAKCENADPPPGRTQRAIVLLDYDSDCDEVKTNTLPVFFKT